MSTEAYLVYGTHVQSKDMPEEYEDAWFNHGKITVDMTGVSVIVGGKLELNIKRTWDLENGDYVFCLPDSGLEVGGEPKEVNDDILSISPTTKLGFREWCIKEGFPEPKWLMFSCYWE